MWQRIWEFIHKACFSFSFLFFSFFVQKNRKTLKNHEILWVLNQFWIAVGGWQQEELRAGVDSDSTEMEKKKGIVRPCQTHFLLFSVSFLLQWCELVSSTLFSRNWRLGLWLPCSRKIFKYAWKTLLFQQLAQHGADFILVQPYCTNKFSYAKKLEGSLKIPNLVNPILFSRRDCIPSIKKD